MFCSWKTGPNASCGCAYRLRGTAETLLEHLCGLGKSTLILRRPGLSLVKSMGLLSEAIGGLENHFAPPQDAFLIREISDSCPLFVMGPPGKPIELTVRLEDHAWSSPVIRSMIEQFYGVSLDCLASRRLGAGAWLDEWGQPIPPKPPAISDLIHQASDALHRCDSLEVEIRTSSHRSTARFQPSFIDSAGSVLRIADKARRHIVYADVNAENFQLSAINLRQLRLAHRA
jgi:hypothetical protein